MLTYYVITCIYCIAFMFGTIGNLFIIFSMLYSKLCCVPKKNNRYTQRERSRAFIFMLACADFIVLLTIPFSLSQILQVKWVFGEVLCRLHAAVDYSGKSISIVLLTAMAIERYIIVCTRWKYTESPIKIIIIPISIGVIFAVVLPTIPQVLFTQLFRIKLERNGQNQNESVCLHIMSEKFVALYVNYTFVCSFAVPLIVMSICYFLLVSHVRNKFRERLHANRSPSSSIRIKRPRYLCGLTRSICRIAIFHFFCLAPYWLFSLLPIYGSVFGINISVQATFFSNAKVYANMLPYINSAGNWLFYAVLNRDVRKHLWRPSSRLRSGFTGTAVSATMSFNNPASDCNESN